MHSQTTIFAVRYIKVELHLGACQYRGCIRLECVSNGLTIHLCDAKDDTLKC